MRNAFIILNHELKNEQKLELQQLYDVSSFIELSTSLQKIWSGFQPEDDIPSLKLKKIIRWLEADGKKDDIVVVQGEFGATFYVVDFCFHHGMVPLYASSKRRYKESNHSDGSVERRHIFRHVKFKPYKRFFI